MDDKQPTIIPWSQYKPATPLKMVGASLWGLAKGLTTGTAHVVASYVMYPRVYHTNRKSVTGDDGTIANTFGEDSGKRRIGALELLVGEETVARPQHVFDDKIYTGMHNAAAVAGHYLVWGLGTPVAIGASLYYLAMHGPDGAAEVATAVGSMLNINSAINVSKENTIDHDLD